MQLTEKDIREFQRLWEKHFGKSISDQDAEEEARSFLLFLQTIFQQ